MIENLDRPLAATDPEAGWCGRADGEKWDPMAVQKYFEGDMHRGPNGSRKPVEILLGILLIRNFAVNAVRRKWSEYALTNGGESLGFCPLTKRKKTRTTTRVLMIENLDRPLAALDPEAGRCWRTNGEKWDLMAGQKCFEGDMLRGLSGSRKPVEIFLGGGKRSPYALRIKAGQDTVDILKSQSGSTVCVLSAI